MPRNSPRPRRPLSPEQNEAVQKAFIGFMRRKGFRPVVELKVAAGRTYWRHHPTGHTVMLFRDDKGQVRTLRL